VGLKCKMVVNMFKRFRIATAALAVMTMPALAQQMQTLPGPGKVQIVAEQKADQWLASEFIGTDVIGADNIKIGDVNDILFDRDGKVVGYIIGVGGFLGIGAKNVALTPDSFQALLVGRWLESTKLILSIAMDELKSASEFKPYNEATPTGMGR
jgi:sporulation protein YlmC with PRC-barrel domain